MSLYSTLIQILVPSINYEVLHDLLRGLAELARAQAIDLFVPSVTRVLTKGIDGLVKIFVQKLEPLDAHVVSHGVIDAFETQAAQFATVLRQYTNAAHAVEAAKKAGEPIITVDVLRKMRESLRRDAQGEMHDMFAVLTGGTPDD